MNIVTFTRIDKQSSRLEFRSDLVAFAPKHASKVGFLDSNEYNKRLGDFIGNTSERVLIYFDLMEHQLLDILNRPAVASMIGIKCKIGAAFNKLHGKGVVFPAVACAPNSLPMMVVDTTLHKTLEALLGHLVLIERFLAPHIPGDCERYHNFNAIGKFFLEEYLLQADVEPKPSLGVTTLEKMLSPYVELEGYDLFARDIIIEDPVILEEKTDSAPIQLTSTTTMLLTEEMASVQAIQGDPDFFTFEVGTQKKQRPSVVEVASRAARSTKIITMLEMLEKYEEGASMDAAVMNAMWHKIAMNGS